MTASEGTDSTQLPADLKRPHARPHLKLARRCYSARLAEVRDQLAAEEASMRTLLQEIEDIQSGRWDERLISSLIMVQPAQGNEPARYGHPDSAAIQETPPNPTLKPSSVGAPLLKASAPGNIPDEPSIEQIANEQAKQASASLEEPTAGTLTSTSANTSVGAAMAIVASPLPSDQQLPNIPEETVAGDDNNTSKASNPKSSTGRASKSTLSERRSSTRVSRNSIASLSELLSNNGNAPSAASTPNEDTSEPTAAPKTHLSPHSAPMELDSSRDSQPPVRKGGRGGRRASVSREGNKRKRTATPNDTRNPSPALSDRSRTKRIKTEELDSSVGTPAAEDERTPFGSDVSARRFRNSAPHLVSQMQGNIHSTFFKEPVRPGEALNYFDIVKRPMDLKTLLSKVKNGKIASSVEFKRDVALIFANAIMYNGHDHHVGQDAVAMWAEVQSLFAVLEQAEQRNN